jgi:hypothetical protein
MTTATTTPADVLAEIERQIAALPDQGDVLNTYNAQAKWAADQSRLVNRRQTITASVATLTKVEPKIAADEKYLADQTGWRKTLSDELLQITSPIRDAAIKARADKLHLSIRLLDFGRRVSNDDSVGYLMLGTPLEALMRASGYTAAPPVENQISGPMEWYGTIGETEGRLKRWRAERDSAQASLDSALREATTV